MKNESTLDPVFEVTAGLAEGYLLGYLIRDSNAWWDAARELDPGDFAGYVNCRIYLAMEELIGSGSHPDIVTVAEHLEHDELFQEAGGLSLLAEMAETTSINQPQQVGGLIQLIHGLGMLRSSFAPRQNRRAVCSLLAAKANGWPHGKSWIVTVEALARSRQAIPRELLGQRACYVYGDKAASPLLE